MFKFFALFKRSTELLTLESEMLPINEDKVRESHLDNFEVHELLSTITERHGMSSLCIKIYREVMKDKE